MAALRWAVDENQDTSPGPIRTDLPFRAASHEPTSLSHKPLRGEGKMLKSRCELEIGGPVPADHAENLFVAIRMSGATYLSVGKTLISARGTSIDEILRRIKDEDFSFIFQEERSHEMPKHLKQCLEGFDLDYRWSWEGYHQVEPGMICVDAALCREARFPAIANRIVLEVSDLDDTARITSAKHWSTWRPRPLFVYASNHERLEALAAQR